MKPLYYQPKDILPGIFLDKESGKFRIYGKSCPVNASEFYDPIFEWLEEYSASPLENTVLDFHFTYFNTVTSKVILKIMSKMEDISGSGNDVTIRWIYNENDEDMEEAGEEFENVVKLKFEMIPVKSTIDDSKDEDYFDSIMDDIM